MFVGMGNSEIALNLLGSACIRGCKSRAWARAGSSSDRAWAREPFTHEELSKEGEQAGLLVLVERRDIDVIVPCLDPLVESGQADVLLQDVGGWGVGVRSTCS